MSLLRRTVHDGRTQPLQPLATLLPSSAGGTRLVVEDYREYVPFDVRDRRACGHAPLRVLWWQVAGCPVRARPPVREVAAKRIATVQCPREHRGRIGQLRGDHDASRLFQLHGELCDVGLLEALEFAGEVARARRAPAP